ncbi:MAG TPA: IS30 family transposase [Lachnospiraceae bacterium]|nr:IS30 family transposase [Lachnospiraceae bacterium]
MKDNQKHLTLSDRIIIEQGLNKGMTFTAIAARVDKDPSTISKEVRKHRTLKQHKDPNRLPKCTHFKTCTETHICKDTICFNRCNECKKCYSICPNYIPKSCGRLDKPPYVCNACSSLTSCLYHRLIYVSKYSDDCYRELLSSSREGINQSPESMQKLDQLVSPLILKGQSLAHIYAHHAEEISCSRRTLYKYISKNVFTVRNIDLPRKVKYKIRRSHSSKVSVNREYCLNRTYNDFNELLQRQPDLSVVEMDTVEGQKGGKVLLTLLFRKSSLMLIFLLDGKTQECVKDVFDHLTKTLGLKNFQNLFHVVLTDRGSEFQAPKELEYNKSGKKRTRIYYCDPQCSWQKGMIEKNHEFIRYVIPKGNTLDCYTQKDIYKLMNHINSISRDNLNGNSPFQLSRMLLDSSLHQKLPIREIHHDEVMLKPTLLKH